MGARPTGCVSVWGCGRSVAWEAVCWWAARSSYPWLTLTGTESPILAEWTGEVLGDGEAHQEGSVPFLCMTPFLTVLE